MVKFRAYTSKKHLEASWKLRVIPAAVTIWHLVAVVRCRCRQVVVRIKWLFGSGASTVWPLIPTENKIGKPTTSSWCRQAPDWMEVPGSWCVQLGTVYYNLFQKRSQRRFDLFLAYEISQTLLGVQRFAVFHPHVGRTWSITEIHDPIRFRGGKPPTKDNKGESAYQICQNLGLSNIKWLLILKPTFCFFLPFVPSAISHAMPKTPRPRRCQVFHAGRWHYGQSYWEVAGESGWEASGACWKLWWDYVVIVE